jgi:Peptidase family M23
MGTSRRARISLGAAGFFAFVALALPAPARAAAGWSWPVEGRVLTPYMHDSARPYAGGMHRGIDIAAPTGTAVRAAVAGEVTFAGVVGTSGLTISIRSSDGRYMTSYLHLERSDVARGTRVGGGDRIGASGTSGRSTVGEPHLHFGVRLADRGEHDYIDPLSLLPSLGGSPERPAAAPVEAPAPARVQPAPVPVPARALHVGDLGARRVSPRTLRQRALNPLPAARAASPLPVPAFRESPASAAAGAHASNRRLVPAGPQPRSVNAAPRPAKTTGAAHATPVEGGEEGGLPALSWGWIAFAGGVLLALSAALAGPALRAVSSLRRLRRTKRSRQRTDEAPGASAAHSVPVLAQLH